MASLNEFRTALGFRDVVQTLVKNLLDTERPRYRYASVISIDRTNYKCTVQFQGDPGTVTVNMGSIQPSAVGQRVRVAGMLGDKYIDAVLGGLHFGGNKVTLVYTAGAYPAKPTGWLAEFIGPTQPTMASGDTWIPTNP